MKILNICAGIGNSYPTGLSMTRETLRLFVPLTILLTLAFTTFEYLMVNARQAEIRFREAGYIGLGAASIVRDLETIDGDVLVLANGETMKRLATEDSQDARRSLAERFLVFSGDRRIYDQIRYIDKTGMEVVRVNFDGTQGTIVADSKLQNKSHRDYFTQTFLLSKGEEYVSQLNLNVENMKVEEPHKPMLRVGTPVFDDEGNKRGVVILNYLAETLLGHYLASVPVVDDRNFIINEEGHWLYSSNSKKQWGFMFGRDQTFATEHPESWQILSTSDSGQFQTDNGLFSFSTVYPNQHLGVDTEAAQGNARASDYSFWKVGRFVPASELSLFSSSRLRLTDMLIFGLLLFMAAAGSWALSLARLSRKRAEERARTSEEALVQSEAVARSGHWIWYTDTQEVIWSKQCYEIFGRDPDIWVPTGENFRDDMPEKDRERLEDANARGFETGEPFIVEYRYYRGGSRDQIRWIMASCNFLRNMNDEVSEMVGIVQDITERKQLEAQLRQSQRMEAVGQLTGGVAHDFNNLLGVMIGNTEMLGDKIDDDENLQLHVDSLKRAIDRASALTSRLLAFSRQQPLSPKTTNIVEQISNFEDMLHGALGETISLDVRASDNLKPALVDPNQLDNALLNVAINSRDAMPDGGSLTIEVSGVTLNKDFTRSYKELTPGGYIRISVSDTGVGMSPEVQDKVFEPFFTTKEFGEGSGLGLSMVFGFIKQSNGHITVGSEKGKGTTISLYLPVARGQIVEKEAVLSPVDTIPRRKTVLLVEDDADVRETAAMLLGDLGYHVYEAEDGPSALRELENLKTRDIPVDLLFSDIVMPHNMSGVELARKIAANHKEIGILLTSGYPDKITDQDDIKALEIELLAKPYKRAQLASALEKTMSRQTENRVAETSA